MGLGGISLWQLLIILLIVVMIFGTKKLRSMGGDLGSAVKGFRKAMKDGDSNDADAPEDEATGNDVPKVNGVIEGEVTSKGETANKDKA